MDLAVPNIPRRIPGLKPVGSLSIYHYFGNESFITVLDMGLVLSAINVLGFFLSERAVPCCMKKTYTTTFIHAASDEVYQILQAIKSILLAYKDRSVKPVL